MAFTASRVISESETHGEAPPLSVPKKRIVELDGLRGIAILLVIIQHYLVVPGVLPGSKWWYVLVWFRLCWSGVELFFVLSGFLIGGILLDVRDSPRYYRTFYLRRALRIIPVYYVFLLVVFSLAFLDIKQEWWQQLFYTNVPPLVYATFLMNFWSAFWQTTIPVVIPVALTILWSLAVEEQFYLLLPFLIRRAGGALVPLLAAGIVLAPVLRVSLQYESAGAIHTLSYALAAILMFGHADALLLGVLAVVAVRNEKANGWIKKHLRLLYGVLGVLLIGMGVLSFEWYPGEPFSSTWAALFYVCLLLIGVSEESGVVKKLLNLKLLTELGVVAYGLYLFHQLVNNLAHGLILGDNYALTSWRDVLVTLFSFLLVFTLARLSWRCFEKPLIRVGHRYRY
jgi:peptidoglycan/LPS O-acetylase OafA/YrhL